MMKVLKEIINGCTSQAPEPAVETTLEMDRFCLGKKKTWLLAWIHPAL